MPNSKFKSAYALEDQPSFRTGLVTDFNTVTYTADVKLDGSEFLTAVPILGMFGTVYGSDLTWLQNLRGAFVLLICVNNAYHILSTIPQQVTETEQGPYPTGTVPGAASTSAETLRKDTAFRNFNPNRPADLLSGDKLIRAEGGAEIGLLQGGVARLKASPMAQLIFGKLKDFGILVARRFRMFSDFGEVEFFHNAAGMVGISVKGGASYQDETHPTIGINTIEMSIGHCESKPGHRIYVETKDTEGIPQTRFSMSMDGVVNVWGLNKVLIESDTDVSITSKAMVNMKAEADVNIEATGNVNVTSEAKVIVKGSTINLN